MAIVPKGPRANVTSIDAKRPRGRPSGLGYDPETGEEITKPTLERGQRADPESDIFALVEQRGYSEDRFYTNSSDVRGHSKMLRIWIPQGIDAQVYGAVNEVPQYRTVQDLVRDAILHRLEYLQRRYQLTDDGRRLLELERWRADSEKRSLEIDTMTGAVDGVSDKLMKAWEAEDYSLFAQELTEAEEQVDWLRDPYKTRMLEVIANWRRKGKAELERVRRQLEE